MLTRQLNCHLYTCQTGLEGIVEYLKKGEGNWNGWKHNGGERLDNASLCFGTAAKFVEVLRSWTDPSSTDGFAWFFIWNRSSRRNFWLVPLKTLKKPTPVLITLLCGWSVKNNGKLKTEGASSSWCEKPKRKHKTTEKSREGRTLDSGLWSRWTNFEIWKPGFGATDLLLHRGSISASIRLFSFQKMDTVPTGGRTCSVCSNAGYIRASYIPQDWRNSPGVRASESLISFTFPLSCRGIPTEWIHTHLFLGWK